MSFLIIFLENYKKIYFKIIIHKFDKFKVIRKINKLNVVVLSTNLINFYIKYKKQFQNI